MTSESRDRHRLIEEAEIIAQEIYKKSLKTRKDILEWKIPAYDFTGAKIRSYDISIKSGLSGIALFYTELFQATNEAKYLDYASYSVNGIVSVLEKEPSAHYGLHSGIMGTVFTLIRLYQITKRDLFLAQAVDYALGSEKFVYSKYCTNSLTDGRSGILLLLIKLHHLTNDDRILQLIRIVCDLIISSAYLVNSGTYWDHKYDQIRGLCGLGYGVSGIAYSLGALSHYLNDEVIQHVVKWAICYENASWHSNFENWPNYNVSISTPEEDSYYQNIYKRDNNFLIEPTDDINYFYGTIGIALSRFRLLDCFETQQGFLFKDIERAVHKLIQTEGHSTLKLLSTHDLSALNILLTQTNELYAKGKIKYKLPEQISNLLEADVEDTKLHGMGLVNGLSGRGYHCLVLAGSIQDSIYAPTFDKDNLIGTATKDIISVYNLTTIKLKLLSRFFPRTLHIMEYISEDNFNFLNDSDSVEPFFDFIKDYIRQDSNKSEFISDIFSLENEAYMMLNEGRSSLKNYIEHFLNYETAQNILGLGDEELLKKEYVLSPNIKVIETKWQWQVYDDDSNTSYDILDNLNLPSDEYLFLLKPTYQEVAIQEVFLSGINQVLIHFHEPLSGEELFDALLEQTEMAKKKDEIELLKSKVIELIITSIQKGFIKSVD